MLQQSRNLPHSFSAKNRGFCEIASHVETRSKRATPSAELFALFAVTRPFLTVLARDVNIEALAAERQEKFLLSAVP
jgi:uncharacterized membrane protein